MGESKAFNVKVGVHQGSVLSPLLFIIVLEALSREFREGLPMKLLYADDLVLIAETKELLLEKVRKWKEGMEKKGLRVNAGKTKIMWCRLSMGQAEDSGRCARKRRSRGTVRYTIPLRTCAALLLSFCILLDQPASEVWSSQPNLCVLQKKVSLVR